MIIEPVKHPLLKIKRERFNFYELNLYDKLLLVESIIDVRAGKYHMIGTLKFHERLEGEYKFYIEVLPDSTWYIYTYSKCMIYVLKEKHDLLLYKLVGSELC
jgi:hypothetical protein